MGWPGRTTIGPDGIHVEKLVYRCVASGNISKAYRCAIDRVVHYSGSVTVELDTGGSFRNGVGLKGTADCANHNSGRGVGYFVRVSNNPSAQG
jgi:hypothetical protein